MCVDSTAYLQISNATFDDNGVYTCEAHNDAGSASCSSVLTVQGQLLSRDLDFASSKHMLHEEKDDSLCWKLEFAVSFWNRVFFLQNQICLPVCWGFNLLSHHEY